MGCLNLDEFQPTNNPLLMETAALRQAKCFEIKPITSALALPSTGSDLSCANLGPIHLGAANLCGHSA
jgi:hypothetical protein